MPTYDLCIIGAGPAGYSAAMRAWDYGKRVALVERSSIGGAGIHNGVLFSKTLWELSRDYRHTLRKKRGFTVPTVGVHFEDVMAAANSAMKEKTSQLKKQLNVLATASEHGPGSITFFQGSARFSDPHTIEVINENQHIHQVLRAKNVLIATGNQPRTLPHIEMDGNRILSSDNIAGLPSFPESLVILGAGVVGCEFATIFANFGKTKVYLIDRADRILPFEDEDIARICSRNLESKGVTIHHGAHLISMDAFNGHVEYTIEHPTGGQETIRVEKALISVGRAPCHEGLQLEKAGVKLLDSGHIRDDSTRTNVPHIYAAGDVTRHAALYHVAELEGRHAVELMFGKEEPSPISYENLSSIMFLDPEVAAIGLNEQQAQALRIPYKVVVYGHKLVHRAIAMRANKGFIKMLVTDDDDMRILGMRSLGVHASTSIEAVSLMIHLGRSVRELGELVHPHPAITEGVQECVRVLCGTSVHKPFVFKNDLRLSTIRYRDNEVQEQLLSA